MHLPIRHCIATFFLNHVIAKFTNKMQIMNSYLENVRRKFFKRSLGLWLAAVLTVLNGLAEETKPTSPETDFSGVEITTVPVTENIFMLTGRGGNIGVCIGDDGIFLIDDQFAPLTERIKKEIKTRSDQPIRFVLNTHWHFDHTGGNENLANAGALILAHDNVRKRLSADQFVKAFNKVYPAQAEAAWPVVTFSDTATFHFNGEEIHIFHVRPAHTDGDSVVHFRNANVIHAGDVFFNGFYPFIDEATDGSIDGMIEAIDRILSISNAETKIIPGHGPLGDRKSLQASRDMLVTVRERVALAIVDGKSLDEIVSSKPLKDLDEKWGQGFFGSDQFVSIVFGLLTNGE